MPCSQLLCCAEQGGGLDTQSHETFSTLTTTRRQRKIRPDPILKQRLTLALPLRVGFTAQTAETNPQPRVLYAPLTPLQKGNSTMCNKESFATPALLSWTEVKILTISPL